MSNTIERQVLDLGTLPTKGVDYWTPEEAEAINKAKDDARNAASEANTYAKEAAIASEKATNAAKAANDAAASVDESKQQAVEAAAYAKKTADYSASAADNAAINANQAAANGNTQYNTLKNYHDNVTVPDHQTAEQDHTRANTDHTTAVSDHQTANTDHTNVTTNWRKEFTDAQAARAAEFNRTQQEKQTEFDRTQAEKQAIFDADHDRAENDHNTLAGGMVVKIQDLMGLYTDREPLTLTPAYSGKAIVAPRGAKLGSLTPYPGASVSVEYSVTRGDMLLIKPGKTSNDYFTVAQVTEQNGVKLYEKVMSLNELAEVPTDGYLRFLVMPSDMVIVVTFFDQEAAFDQTIRVMRCGAFATISTQVGNIYADLKENYAKAQGYYKDLHCGVADSLGADPSKTYTEIIPCGRPLGNAGSLTDGTGGSHSPESIGEVSTVEIKEIEGGCFGGNQMSDNKKGDDSTYNAYTRTTVSKEGDSVRVTQAFDNGIGIAYITRKEINAKNNDKFLFISNLSQNRPVALDYYIRHDVDGSVTELARVRNGASICKAIKDGHGRAALRLDGAVIDDFVQFDSALSVLNLTTLFPTPSGQSFVATLGENDTPKVLDRLGFFAFMSE